MGFSSVDLFTQSIKFTKFTTGGQCEMPHRAKGLPSMERRGKRVVTAMWNAESSQHA